MNRSEIEFIEIETAKRLKSYTTAYLNKQCESTRQGLRYYNAVSSLLTSYLEKIKEEIK